MKFPRHFFQSQVASPSPSQIASIIDAACCDVLVLDADFIISTAAQNQLDHVANRIRTVNPDAYVFAYISPADYQSYQSDFVCRLKLGFDPEWLVRSVGDKKPIALFQAPDGTSSYLMNLTMPAFREHLLKTDRKSTRLNSSHSSVSRMPSSA